MINSSLSNGHLWSSLLEREETVFDENGKTRGTSINRCPNDIPSDVLINETIAQSGDNVIIDFAICQVLRDPEGVTIKEDQMNQQSISGSSAHLAMQFCTITTDMLNIRSEPSTGSSIVATYPQGTVLNFIEIMEGEMVNGVPYWGLSAQGHYFWMGGTDWHKQ